jgi:hypothetical protein
VVDAGPELIVAADDDALEESSSTAEIGVSKPSLVRMPSTASGLVTRPAYMRAMSTPVNLGIRKKIPNVTMLMMISSSAEVTSGG